MAPAAPAHDPNRAATKATPPLASTCRALRLGPRRSASCVRMLPVRKKTASRASPGQPRRHVTPAPTTQAATSPQETEKQLFEVELLAARWAVGQVLADLLLHRGRELAVEVLIEMLLALPTIHLADPLMYPIPTA